MMTEDCDNMYNHYNNANNNNLIMMSSMAGSNRNKRRCNSSMNNNNKCGQQFAWRKSSCSSSPASSSSSSYNKRMKLVNGCPSSPVVAAAAAAAAASSMPSVLAMPTAASASRPITAVSDTLPDSSHTSSPIATAASTTTTLAIITTCERENIAAIYSYATNTNNKRTTMSMSSSSTTTTTTTATAMMATTTCCSSNASDSKKKKNNKQNMLMNDSPLETYYCDKYLHHNNDSNHRYAVSNDCNHQNNHRNSANGTNGSANPGGGSCGGVVRLLHDIQYKSNQCHIDTIHIVRVSITDDVVVALIDLLYYDMSRKWKCIEFQSCKCYTTTTTGSAAAANDTEAVDMLSLLHMALSNRVEKVIWDNNYGSNSSSSSSAASTRSYCPVNAPPLQMVVPRGFDFGSDSDVSNGSAHEVTTTDESDTEEQQQQQQQRQRQERRPTRRQQVLGPCNDLLVAFGKSTGVVAPTLPPCVPGASAASSSSHSSSSLKVLVVRQNSLSVCQAYALGLGISYNSTNLEELIIQNTVITNKAAQALANGLLRKDNNNNNTNSLGGDGGGGGGNSSIEDHSLKCIDMSNCKLNDTGLSYIINALKNSSSNSGSNNNEGKAIRYTNVTSLVLRGVHAGPKTLQALSVMLQNQSKLQNLDLSDGRKPIGGGQRINATAQSPPLPPQAMEQNPAAASVAAAAAIAVGDLFNATHHQQRQRQLQLLLQQHQVIGGGAHHYQRSSRNPGQRRILVKRREVGLCDILSFTSASMMTTMMKPNFASLQRLDLTRNGLHDDDMIHLSKAMSSSSSSSVLSAVEELNIGFNNITDHGIVNGLAKYMPNMYKLKRITLNPNPFTKKRGGDAIVHALKTSNYIVEHIDTLFCLHSPLLCNEIRYYTNLNRGGRRILHATACGASAEVAVVESPCSTSNPSSVTGADEALEGNSKPNNWNDSNDIPISLWPKLLGRVNSVKYHSVTEGYCSNDALKRIQLDVMYHLINNAGPTMFSMTTVGGGGIGGIGDSSSGSSNAK